MSTRSSIRFVLPLFSAVLLSAGAGFAISACSSSTTDGGTATSEGGTDAGTDSGRIKVDAAPTPEDDAATTLTPQQCVDACNKAHPASTAKETAIDTCWTTSCKGPCLDDPATGFDAGAEGGADSGADPLCGTGVTSSTADCDNCTEANCCPAWKGCFDDQDCSDLDTCIGKCFP